MTDLETLELLRAVLAVAAADGDISRSETGLIMGLAARIGVGQASLQAMVEAAKRGEAQPEHLVIQSAGNACTALELLVAEARLDGEISEAERHLLVTIAARLKITGPEFNDVYRAGLQRADKLRKSRGTTQKPPQTS